MYSSVATDPMTRLLLPTSSTTILPTLASSSWATLLAFLPSDETPTSTAQLAASVMPPPIKEEWNKFNRNENSSLDVRQQRGDRLIPLVMTEHGAMDRAHFKAYIHI